MQNKIFNFPQSKPLSRCFKANLSVKMAGVLCAAALWCFCANALAQSSPPSSPGGTSGATSGGASGNSSGAAKGNAAKPDPNNDLMNEGDEVDGNVTGQGKGKNKNATQNSGANSAPATPSKSQEKNSTPTGEQKPEWSVWLASFTEQGHAAAAATMREAIVKRYPMLSAAHVCSLESGSVIVYGSFVGLDDPKAKPAIKMVKDIEENGVRPFARSYLIRLQTTSNNTKQGPYDLSKVRVRFPNVVPLFTVKVATWSDFKSDEIPFAEIKAKAEAYCAKLRLQGFEAYVKNDADDRSSMVTIGVFDSTAYDARTTLFHPDVEKILKKFPVLLVNGEPLLEPPPRGLQNAKPTAKACVLIEIPR